MAFLEVSNLSLSYATEHGSFRAVEDVSFSLQERGESLGIIGETGSGKTSLLHAVLRIYPKNVDRASGTIILEGEDLTSLPEELFRLRVRWKKIAVVFQAAMNGGVMDFGSC